MKVLYIVGGSITDPVVRSQGLPHISALAGKGFQIFVLSVEVEKDAPGRAEYEMVVKQYTGRIRFLPVRLPVGKLLRPQVQLLLAGLVLAPYYTIKYRIDCIHARSYVPAILGLLAKRILNVKLIFDMRGLFVDEYISKGAAKEGSLQVSLMRLLERRCILAADQIVVVSEQFKVYLLQLPYLQKVRMSPRIEIIQNCTDIERFRFETADVARLRAQYKIEGRTVFVYSGSLATWQLSVEIARFFKQCLDACPQSYLLWLTYGQTDALDTVMNNAGIDNGNYSFHRARVDEIPTFLSLGDVGMILRRDEPLNRVASPLKFGEYLAAGLPVVLTKGIGDTREIIEKHRVGVVINSLSDEDYRAASTRVFGLLGEGREALRTRCRDVARQYFSLHEAIEKYNRIYERLDARR